MNQDYVPLQHGHFCFSKCTNVMHVICKWMKDTITVNVLHNTYKIWVSIWKTHLHTCITCTTYQHDIFMEYLWTRTQYFWFQKIKTFFFILKFLIKLNKILTKQNKYYYIILDVRFYLWTRHQQGNVLINKTEHVTKQNDTQYCQKHITSTEWLLHSPCWSMLHL